MELFTEEKQNYKQQINIITETFLKSIEYDVNISQEKDKLLDEYNQKNSKLEQENEELKKNNLFLINENKSLKEEKDNMNKVSLMKQLHLTIDQKSKEIESLKKQLDISKKKVLRASENNSPDTTGEQCGGSSFETSDTHASNKKDTYEHKTSNDSEKESESESDTDPEPTSYSKKKIKGIYYFVTQDEDRYVFNIDDDDKIGDKIGQIVNKKFIKLK